MIRGRYTEALLALRYAALADGRFEPITPGAEKIRCTVCTEQSPSAAGHVGGTWMDAHMAGHEVCPDCGKVRPTKTMRAHRSSRWHERKESA